MGVRTRGWYRPAPAPAPAVGELQIRKVPSFLAVKMSVPPGVTVQIGFGHPAAEPGSRIAGWNGSAGSGAGYGRLIAWKES